MKKFSLRSYFISFGWGLILIMLGASAPAREPPAGQLALDRSSPPPTATPDAECPPATTEVPPDRASAKATTPTPSLPDALQPGNRSPQADCYLPPQDAAAQFRNGTAYLIDIRARSAFEQYRIPGAFNLPAYAIKTKPFLKTRPLILVDVGYRSRSLEILCQELRQQQFKVTLLDGGLNAWPQPLTSSDPLAQDHLRAISPAVYFTEREDARWQIVDVSAQALPVLAALPGGAAVSATLDPPAFGQRLKQIAAQRQKILGTAPYLLLVNANGDYDRIKALLRDDSIPNVFYLKDGLHGYDAYLKSLAALRERAPPPPSNRRCGLAPR